MRSFLVCGGKGEEVIKGRKGREGEDGRRKKEEGKKGWGEGGRGKKGIGTFLGSWKLTWPVAMEGVLRRLDHGV